MHALMFQLKRAHLRALAGAQALSYKTGLTPARHDILRCIESFGVPYVEGHREEYQSRLWRALGISRTSASKMVRRLIELGLAQRRRAPRDKRTFLVSLTREGRRRMRRAFLIIYRRRPFQRRFERAFSERGERSWTTHHAVKHLIFAVQRVAKHLRDASWPLYITTDPPDDPIDDVDESGPTDGSPYDAEPAEPTEPTEPVVTPPAAR